MSDIYKMTQANEVPVHGRTQGNLGMPLQAMATESNNDLERLLRVLVSTVKLQGRSSMTLQMGTMGNNVELSRLPKPREIPLNGGDGQSTLMNAVANEDEPVGPEVLCREIGLLKGAIHSMHQDQLALQVHLM